MKLKELAGQLGLSQTTVSRALNGYPEVSEATRQRVLEAARRFDYRPNVSARRLATGRAGAIGAVLQTDRNLLEILLTRPVHHMTREQLEGTARGMVARKMMNLSSSFDHRVIDGMVAAEFIQTVRSYLEAPATLFVE